MQENFFLELKSLYEKDKLPVFVPGDVYMLLRYLSFDPGVFGVVEQANRLALVLPTESLVAYLFCVLPKQKASFIKLPKTQKQMPETKVLQRAMQIFCCGASCAQQILSIYESAGLDFGEKLGLR